MTWPRRRAVTDLSIEAGRVLEVREEHRQVPDAHELARPEQLRAEEVAKVRQRGDLGAGRGHVRPLDALDHHEPLVFPVVDELELDRGSDRQRGIVPTSGTETETCLALAPVGHGHGRSTGDAPGPDSVAALGESRAHTSDLAGLEKLLHFDLRGDLWSRHTELRRRHRAHRRGRCERDLHRLLEIP